jgi:hypothetical protein
MIVMFALALRPAVSVAVTLSVRTAPAGVVTVVVKLPLHPTVSTLVE